MRRGYFLVILIAVFVAAGSSFATAQNKKAKSLLSSGQKGAVSKILSDESIKNAKVSIKIVALNTMQTVFEKNPGTALIPASTNKIVTGAAALDRLGSNFNFTTRVYTDGALSANGILDGDIYIKGGGDPSISLEKTWLISHLIRSHGITQVKGSLIGDESFFDEVRHYSQWGKVGTRAYHAPMGALCVNFNTIGVYVAPGQKEGEPALAVLNPRTKLFVMENRLKTTVGGRSRVAISFKEGTCIVSGQIPIDSKPRTYHRSIVEPLPFALSAIQSFCEQEGIKFGKLPTKGSVPPTARLLFEYASPPLNLIIRGLFRNSNNFTAESIGKTLGASLFDAPGTQEKASKAITEWIADKKLIDSGVVIADGSGLARENRLSANVLVGVLLYMWSKPELSPEFIDAMAIGGVDGTLKRRFSNSPLFGRIRAKSGLLWGVISLAGYCYNSKNEPYAFAVLINDYNKNSTGRDIQKITENLLNVLMQ